MFASNEAYTKGGMGPENAAAYQAVTQESLRKNLGYGTVHVYIIGADGHVLTSMGVVRALQNDNLRKMLETSVLDWKLKAGAPLVKPHPQSRAPKAPRDALILHVTARGFKEGSWREFPAENWIVLTPEEARKLAPPAGAAEGATWEVDQAVARKILTTFYPQTEDTDSTDRNQMDHFSIKGKVISVKDGVVRARLDSTLQMRRSFYPGRKDLTQIQADSLGYVEAPADAKRVDAVEMVTSKATFGDEEFGVAVRSNYESPAP